MESLRLERRDGVVTLTIDRPERRNALDVPTWQALAGALREAGGRPDDRVVVLRGAGGTFCAGGDLSGAADPAAPPGAAANPVEAVAGAMRRSVSAACLALHRLPIPAIAAVEGVAAGAGANLAFGCDLVVAGASARFGEVFIRRALPLDSGGSWLLPRLVGLKKAKELAFFGDWLGAEEAAELGLVNRVCADAEVQETARAWAERLAGSSRVALALSKQALDRSSALSFEEALELEALGLAKAVASDEFRAAMAEFAPGRRR